MVNETLLRLGNGVLELPVLSQVQSELQTDGNTPPPLDEEQREQSDSPITFPMRSRNTLGLNHPGWLLKALGAGAQGWTYCIRTRQGQEFACLRSSGRVSSGHSCSKTQTAPNKHSQLALIIAAVTWGLPPAFH